jgi:hypothetical protein
VLGDEGGVDAGGLDELADELVEQTRGGVGRGALNAELLDLLEEVHAGLC